MSFFSWLASAIGNRQSAIGHGLRKPKAGSRKPPRFRPQLEALEDRMLPSTYYAATASDLIADIKATNLHGGANTIVLTAPTSSPYVLTAVDNSTDGPTGLPVISGGGKKVAADTLTIVGNGDTIEKPIFGPTTFRLFDVALGASLTLEDLTLQNGSAFGSGVSAEGGAILNQGVLSLEGVTVQNNSATGYSADQTTLSKNVSAATGADAQGGGIWSDGTLFLQDFTLPTGTVLHTILQNNYAQGGYGGSFFKGGTVEGASGGQGLGGALYLAGGTAGLTNAALTNVSFIYNSAFGGNGGDNFGFNNGGNAGAAFGGAVDIADAGTVVMNRITLENNVAVGGNGGFSSVAMGGAGGNASGGAVSVTGGLKAGTVSMSGMFFQGNIAVGGSGGESPTPADTTIVTGLGGNAYGGAIFLGAGSANGVVMIRGTTVQGNKALGGEGVAWGIGAGGGIYNAGTQSGLMVLNSTFSANTPDNIFGPYIDGGGNTYS
jgi:hypothetical protein